MARGKTCHCLSITLKLPNEVDNAYPHKYIHITAVVINKFLRINASKLNELFF